MAGGCLLIQGTSIDNIDSNNSLPTALQEKVFLLAPYFCTPKSDFIPVKQWRVSKREEEAESEAMK